MSTVSNASDFGKVAVLMGGTSAEREISLQSGEAVLGALQSRGVDAVKVDVDNQVASLLAEGNYDRAFIVLHGRGGEDGVIQGLLENLQLPYTGSDVLGSALGMHKLRCKWLWAGAGLPTPAFVLLASEADLVRVADETGFPVMIKPAREGSSIGMARVENAEQLKKAWQEASQYDDCVMAEQWIEGQEFTVGVLGHEALPVIRLETPHDFYDYEAKYQTNDTRYLIPCGLDEKSEARVQALAVQAFDIAGASGWGRVDMMMDADGNPWLIEINTVPGMTDHSLVPKAAKAAGMDFPELCWRILETAA